ncbi:hypothetical protein [Paenibacillus sp. y28]|uniref:hypothetical protein n=1 Tax=Paenibacillus sp. y28 TaxID=3129110 RepID=UPI003017BF03
MKTMKQLAVLAALTAVLASACAPLGSNGTGSKEAAAPAEHGAHSDPAGGGHGRHSQDAGPGEAAASGVKVQFKLTADKVLPQQDAVLTMHVQDQQGNSIDRFDLQHEKLMHLIIVSKDLSFFSHLHPEYKSKGEFTITTQFPAAGEYKLISDIVPSGMSALSRSQWIQVEGTAPARQPVAPDTSLTKTVDGKEITLSFDHLMAGMDLGLAFHIQDAQTKQSVTNLEPYLGAVGHVVILSEDAGNYLHVHPVDEKAKGPDAKFMTAFPHSGVYKIWGQFQHNGKVLTVPFVVKVP